MGEGSATVFSLAGKSLYAPSLDLWIDSMASRERCYVSHGHSDHARAHATVVATPNTASICRARFARRTVPKPQLSLLPRNQRERIEVTFEERHFNEAWEEREHRLTLFSAGHVLGSSQLMIESENGRFVYTGDFKLASSLTVEPPEVKRCDTLLMECTFGRPQYAFPPREEIAEAMIAFARKALEDGAVPVFFAYSLGKAQEAIAMLGGAGLKLAVHSAVDTMSRVYLDCGVQLPPFERYDQETSDANSVFVWPPGATLPKELRDRVVRTAVLTGWALDRGALFRYGTQHGFALSDHADYPALLKYIELAQPKKVYLNHGWRDFMFRLRGLGVDAEYLEENTQLTLF